MTPPLAAGAHSRRAVLASAAAGGAGIAFAGCGNRSLRSRVKSGTKVSPADVDVLNRLLDLEYYAIAAYSAGIPLLGRPETKAAKQFLAQELAHASTLAGLVKQAGAKPVNARASYDLGVPRRREVLALLHQLEGRQLAAYVGMIPELSPGHLRSAVAAIMANDAQHLAVLREAIGRSPVPSAFATGVE